MDTPEVTKVIDVACSAGDQIWLQYKARIGGDTIHYFVVSITATDLQSEITNKVISVL